MEKLSWLLDYSQESTIDLSPPTYQPMHIFRLDLVEIIWSGCIPIYSNKWVVLSFPRLSQSQIPHKRVTVWLFNIAMGNDP